MPLDDNAVKTIRASVHLHSRDLLADMALDATEDRIDAVMLLADEVDRAV